MKLIFSKARTSVKYRSTGINFYYILFLLLFVFLIPFVKLRDVTLLVRVDVPSSLSSATKIKREDRAHHYPYLYVGESLEPFKCFPTTKSQIQVNDVFITKEQITEYLSYFQGRCPPLKRIIYLKIDRHTKMDVVHSIKEQISESGSCVICYVVK